MPNGDQPTIQSITSDPHFYTLSENDRIAVLGQVDPNFKGLKTETQLEVMTHLRNLNLPGGTIGPNLNAGVGPQGKDESYADYNARVLAAEKAAQANPGVGQQNREGLKEDIRTALPYVGGAAASLLAGPEAGIPVRMGLAALGGATGSVASHAVPGGTQPKLMSPEGALDVGLDAAKQATFELGGAIVGKGIKGLVGRLTTKVPVEEAAAKIADSIAPETTPAEFGDVLRNTLTATRQTLGQQKGQVLDSIVSKFQPTQPNFLNTRFALNESIASLQAQKNLAPSLFQAGQPKAKTLAVLQDLYESINGGAFEQPGQSVIRGMDTLRSNLFQMGKGIDSSLPKSIVNNLTHAVHDDIGKTLEQFGPDGMVAFQQFEAASAKFRETADILDTSTFKRILKANVNQPEKVLNILMQAPETNIENLTTILKNAPNGSAVIDSMKHLALEKAASTDKFLESIPEPARQVVFGKDLPKIEQFFDSVESPSKQGMISKIVTHAGGVVGGGAAGAAVGHPMLGIGTGEMLANWIIRSGTETRTISAPQLAIMLGNPTTRQLLIKAAQTPASGQASALLLRAIGTYAELPPAAPPPQPPPVAAGASIGQQLQSKGIPLPQSPPTTPGLPFHPNQQGAQP